MIPYTYNMVSFRGTDLSEINGEAVDGIYGDILSALNECRVVVLYDWKFAGILVPPAYCAIEEGDSFILINGIIKIEDDDTVWIESLVPPGPVLVELIVDENGQFSPQDYDADGFSEVTVNVPQQAPVIESLSVTDNGTYEAPEGVDGYSPVSVNVSSAPSPKEPLSVDVSSGYVASGSWTYSTTPGSYADVYEAVAGHRYFLCLGQQVSNRFRCMFSTSNPALATSSISGIGIGADNNSPSSNVFNPTVYQAPSNGFITVGKSNNNTSGIKSYCWDLTELGISPPTT